MIDEHGEEEDEKTKRDLEIWKKYHEKDTKSVKKIFIALFFLASSFLSFSLTFGFVVFSFLMTVFSFFSRPYSSFFLFLFFFFL